MVDYLNCFRSNAAKALVRDELETLYEELKDKRERLEVMDVIGKDGICFEDPEDADEEDDLE